MKEIKVKYFVDGIDELCYVAGKSDWIDLHAAEDVDMKAGEFRLIPLGVAIELPEGYEAHVVPRSSTFKNYCVTSFVCFCICFWCCNFCKCSSFMYCNLLRHKVF